MSHLHSVYDNDTHFTINPTTRVITNTTAKSKLVQFDHNSERFTFEMPRYVEEHDMTLCNKIEIHYINVSTDKKEQSTDVYRVEDIKISPDDNSVAIFSWLISGNATKYAGTLNFLVRFTCLTGEKIEYAWNTAIFDGITVASGIDNGEAVIAEYSDVLEAWKRDILAVFDAEFDIVQTTGDSPSKVMSQKAVTDAFKFKWGSYSLPVLLLYGDPSAMTKDNAVTLGYEYGAKIGTCEVKWQGSSSIAFPKKNYTVKFDTAFEAAEGWGVHNKYCLKADWIDFSHCRNVVSAKLWGDIVRSRAASDLATKLAAFPNCGAIDGFPCFVVINGEWQGIYNFNIPKDGYMLGMTERASGKEAILCADNPDGLASRLMIVPEVISDDFSIEFVSNEDNDAWVQTSLVNMAKACLENGGNLDIVENYLDIDSAIDYFIFCALTYNTDGVGKNNLLCTYDGTKWFFTAYDLDGTWGLSVYGNSFNKSEGVEGGSFKHMATRHAAFRIVYYNARERLIHRYKELRNGAMGGLEVMARFYNYANQFPATAKIAEAEKWLAIPSTDVNNVAQIAAWYTERTRALDAEIAYLETKAVTNQLRTAQAFTTTGVYNGVGYKNGYIFSETTQGYESAKSGYVTTGIIPYDGLKAHYHPIYIKGNIDLDDTSDASIRFVYSKNNKASIFQTAGLAGVESTWNVTKLGKGYYRFYPKVGPNIDVPLPYTWYGAFDGIAFSLKGSGEGLVVSLDDPINE